MKECDPIFNNKREDMQSLIMEGKLLIKKFIKLGFKEEETKQIFETMINLRAKGSRNLKPALMYLIGDEYKAHNGSQSNEEGIK